MPDTELATLFCNLVSIPSPSGNERDIANHIYGLLKKDGFSVKIDETGKLNESNTGNVIVTIPGNNGRLVFIAHMDTVEIGGKKIKPIIKDGVIRSDGSTVLGADNKAGVAPLISALKEIRKMENRPNVMAVFSTREENGVMGAKFIRGLVRGDKIFVLDGGAQPGTFINKSLGSTLFDIEIFGREAHAAVEPEKGANAVKAAGLVISSLRLGKRKNDSILNIGIISGGRKRNVVPGYALLSCGTRAFDQKTVAYTLKEVEGAVKSACKATGCTYKISLNKEFYPPFSTGKDTDIAKIAKKACDSIGLNFEIGSRMATYEANVLSGKKSEILVMGQGCNDMHSPSESIEVANLENTRNLIIELVKASSGP